MSKIQNWMLGLGLQCEENISIDLGNTVYVVILFENEKRVRVDFGKEQDGDIGLKLGLVRRVRKMFALF